MRKKLLSFVLALSLAVPNMAYASESVQTPVESNTEEVGNNDVPVVIKPDDVSAKEETVVKNAPTVVNHSINADNGYSTYDLLTTDNPVYVETNKQLPIGISIQSSNAQSVRRTQGAFSIFLSCHENTEWHSGSYTLKVHEKKGNSWEHVKTVNLTVTNSKSPTADANVHFTRTTPSNIFLKPGEEFTLSDTLSNGSTVEYITDRIQLFLDKAGDEGPNPKRAGTTEDEIYKAFITHPNSEYTYAYVNDGYNSSYKDQVFKIENGKIKAVNYGSALVWATDAGRNVFYPIAINVRDSERVFVYKDESKELKGIHNLYSRSSKDYRAVASFVNTTSLQKAFNSSTIPLTINSQGYYYEATTHNMLYSDRGVLSAAMHEWRKANDVEGYRVRANRSQNTASNSMILANNYHGLETSWAVHELIHWGSEIGKGYINHVDAMWFVTSKPNSIITNASGSSISLKVGESCSRDISNFFSGGTGVLRFTTTDAPRGTSLSITGVLSGTPTGNEKSMTVKAIDAFGNSATLAIPITIEQPVPTAPPQAQQQQKPTAPPMPTIVDKKRYTISATKTGQGEIEVVSSAGSSYAYENDMIAINATPAEGYVVGLVTLDGQPKTTTFVSKKVTGNTTYNVEFVPKLKVKENADTSNLNISQHIEGGKAPFKYELISAPSGVTINNSTGQISITSDESKAGTVQITDSSINKQSVTSNYNRTLNKFEELPSSIEVDATGDKRIGSVDLSYLSAWGLELVGGVNNQSYSDESIMLKLNHNSTTTLSYAVKNPLLVSNISVLCAVANDGSDERKFINLKFLCDNEVPVTGDKTGQGSLTFKDSYSIGTNAEVTALPFTNNSLGSFKANIRYINAYGEFSEREEVFTKEFASIQILPNMVDIRLTAQFNNDPTTYNYDVNFVKDQYPGNKTINLSDYIENLATPPDWTDYSYFYGLHEAPSFVSFNPSNASVVVNEAPNESFSFTISFSMPDGLLAVHKFNVILSEGIFVDDYIIPEGITGTTYNFDISSLYAEKQDINVQDFIVNSDSSFISQGLGNTINYTYPNYLSDNETYIYISSDILSVYQERVKVSLPNPINPHLYKHSDKKLDKVLSGKEVSISFAKSEFPDADHYGSSLGDSSNSYLNYSDYWFSPKVTGNPNFYLKGNNGSISTVFSPDQIAVTLKLNSSDVLMVEWLDGIFEIPITVVEPLPQTVEITKQLDNIGFDFNISGLFKEAFGKNYDKTRYSIVSVPKTDITSKALGRTLGCYKIDINTVKGVVRTAMHEDDSPSVEISIIDTLAGKSSTLNLNLVPKGFLVANSTASSVLGNQWSVQVTGNTATNELPDYMNYMGTLFNVGDILSAKVTVANPNKELDYLNITYYTLGNFNGDGYMFGEIKTEKVYLDNTDTWKYFVDGSYAKLEITPVLKSKLALTNADLNVESSTWYLTHGLDQHITGGTAPYKFTVKNSTYSNGLSISQDNKICGDVPKDGSATVTAYDSSGGSLDFTLNINVPDPVTIVINNDEEKGAVSGIHEEMRAKIGDTLSFRVYAEPELRVKSIDVNDTLYDTHTVDRYLIEDETVTVTTDYTESITYTGNGITGGIPPYTYSIIDNGGYDQLQLKDNRTLKIIAVGELDDGYYDVLVEARDSSPTPLTCQFYLGYEHINEEVAWHSVLVPELSGGSVKVTAPEGSISTREDGYAVPDGTEITVTATPVDGFKFSNFVRPNVTEPETKLTVTDDIILLANFNEIPQPSVTNPEGPTEDPDGPTEEPEEPEIPPISLQSIIEMDYGEKLNLQEYTSGGEAPYSYMKQDGNTLIAINQNGDVILGEDIVKGSYELLVLIGDGSSSVYTNFTLIVNKHVSEIEIEVPSPDPGPYPLPYPVPTEWVLPLTYEKVSGPDTVVIDKNTGSMSIDGEIPVGKHIVVVGVTDSSSPANYDEFSYVLNVYPKNPEIPTGPIEIKVPSDPVPVGPIEGWVPPFTYKKIEGHEGINIVDNKWVVDSDVPSGEHKMVYKITDARGKYIIKDFEITVVKGDEDVITEWPTNEEIVINPDIPSDWKLPVKYYKEEGHSSIVVAEDTGAISVTGDIEPGEHQVAIRMEDSSEPKKSKIYTVNVKVKEGAGLEIPNAGYFLIYIPLDGEPVLPSIKDRLYGYDEPISIVDIDTTDGLSISDNDLITADSTVTSGKYTIKVQVSDATHEAQTFDLPVRVVRVPVSNTNVTIPGNGEIDPSIPEEDEWIQPYTYTKVGGHDSIRVNANTGMITVDNNIPSGNYEVIIRVTDSSTPAKSKDYTHNLRITNYNARIEINGKDPIVVNIPKAPTPVVWPNLEDMTTGGVGPYTYEIIGDNTKISISDNCLIVADEVESGDYNIYLRVKDSVGNESTLEKIVTVVRRTKYQVESNILPENAGTVNLSNIDDTVSANAVSNEGYVFSHYVIYDEEVRENPYTFDLHIDTVIDAYFNEKMRTNQNTNANQTKDNTVNLDVKEYFEGGTAPYEYTLKEDYDGLSINEDGIITGNVSQDGMLIVVSVSDNSLPSDTLEIPITINPMHKYTPIVKIQGLGTVSIDKLMYTEGEEATFIAYPSKGYVFKHFMYNGEELTDKTVKLAITEDFRILAVFEKNFITRKPDNGEDPLDLNNYVDGGEGDIIFEGKDLPNGITIDENNKIVIDKEIVLPGEYVIIIDAIDENGNKISFEVIVDVENPLKQVTPEEGEDERDLDNYVDGGKGEITFEPVDLPNGFTIDDENRIVVDDSVEPGTHTIVVDAIDEAGNKIVIVIEIEIEESFRNRTPAEGEDKLDLDNYVSGGKGKIEFEPQELPDGFSIDEDNRIIVDEDNVKPGNHKVIVDAKDEDGNTITIEVEVTVDDKGNTDVEEIKEFKVTSALTPSTAGVIELSDYVVKDGDVVTAEAHAYSGYEFVMWIIEGKEYDSNPVSHIVTKDVELVAIYRTSNEIDLDNLPSDTDKHPPIKGDEDSNIVDLDDIISGGSGNHEIIIIEIPEGVDYDEEEGTLTNNTGEDKTVVIQIKDGDKVIIVEIIVPKIPMVNVNISTLPLNSGTVSGNTTYQVGDVVTLTAIPNEGVEFAGWDVEGIDLAAYTSETISFIMPNRDVEVVAMFDDPASNEIPKGIWYRGVLEHDYTGAAIKPVIRVYDGTKLLREKIDYTLAYKNNKNAYTFTEDDSEFNGKKAPTIVLKTKGNYKGSRNIYFTINPIDINEVNGLTDIIGVTSNGKKVTVNPKLTWNNKKLVKKDFTVESISDNSITADGTYDMQIIGKGNFTGEFDFKLVVTTNKSVVPVSKLKVSKLPSMIYTGKALVPTDFTIKYNKDIPESDEYTVSFRNNVNIGKAELIITGTGKDSDKDGISYIGQHIVNYSIVGPQLKKATINGLEKSYTFTGERIVPDFDVVLEGKTLVRGKDYKIEATNNLNKGKATLTITALTGSNCSGSKKVSFTIKPEENFTVSLNSVSGNDFKLTKGGTKPSVTVYDGVTVLEEGTDYTLSYKNNRKVATLNDKKAPTVVVTGKGNYRGKVSVNFNIIPTALSADNGIRLVVADKVESPKKGGYIQKFTIYDSDGKKLTTKEYDKNSVTYTVSGNDAPLTKSDVVAAGTTIKVTVQGKGSYAGGEVSATYKILPNGTDISKAKASIKPQQYTGKSVSINSIEQFKDSKVVLKSAGSSTELVFGKDFIVLEDSYVNNVKRGTAKVTIQGIGSYGGQKTLTFKIGQRTINDFWTGLSDLLDLL